MCDKHKFYNDFPPVHPNCTCEIVAGSWWLGTSDSGPCDICVEKARAYNGFSHQLFAKDREATMARVAKLREKINKTKR